MAQADKMLAKMARNPKGDWVIADIERVCARFGIACVPPANGSHYKVSHPSQIEILPVPARRPIKPVYITDLVAFIERVRIAEAEAEAEAAEGAQQ